MKYKSSILVIALASFLLFNGCSKEVEEYNKPAAYWYSKVISSIASGEIEKADNYYSSLQGEHIGSPLLPEATLILAIAHMHYEEYLLSEHFSNEYMKRYSHANEREFVEFLKIKAKYMALPNPRRDQVLIKEAIKDSKTFKMNYPRSIYYPLVDTMLTNLNMAEAALNESIADLYVRLDKPKSAEYYRNIKKQNWINFDEIDRANSPWYREMFEGDGTESWYTFMIPDTQSVVSRNTAREEYTPQDQNSTANGDLVEKEDNKPWYKSWFSFGSSEDEMKEVSKEEVNEEAIEVEAVEEEVVEQSFVNETPKVSAQQEDEIKKAQELMEKGALSEEEFETTKDEILKQEEKEISQEKVQSTNDKKSVAKKAQKEEKPWYKPWFGTEEQAEPEVDSDEEAKEEASSWYNFLSW